MKKTKVLSVIFTALFLTVIPFSNVFATSSESNLENDSHEYVIEISDEEVKMLEEKQLQEKINELDPSNQLRTPTYEYKSVLQDSKELLNVSIGWAGNQPSRGTVFSSSGGFIWNSGGYYSNVTLNIGYGPISASFPKGSVGGSTGTYISSPWINTPVKLHIARDIKVSNYKVYGKYYMDPTNNWQYFKSEQTAVSFRNRLTVKKVQ
ncbi:hypothetical protein SAMN05421839_1723 [Halolactibacillus halophilus]|uniref:Uncharacterized protein n=1 Tax=Halolactibacillus halophilus TaxID=306540 RepID=A0A1I5TC39_9BACI|nr:hypothetical protein [Halolactibacillus halophilus]GEM02943.1 hypothetical protein HHA03_24750 [Halolactibacillus halophilus]SFP80227.1 hypothetical protein SAMN05421839_1723 [Halolactibacillus halophilus]